MDPDVLIIGGGVIGHSIARELHKRGVKRITLVEKGICGEESSWAAAGMLGPQAEADEDGPFFDMMVASRDLYPAFAAELLDETGIAGTLYLAFTDEDVRHIRTRYEWQKNAGLPVEHLSAEEVRRAEPFVSPDIREALFFPGDWQVENRKLLSALRQYAELNGIKIIENTQVERLIVDTDRVTGVKTGSGHIASEQTILATGAWTSLIKAGLAEIPLKVEPIRGQMIGFQTAKRLFRRVIYSRRGYIVPRADGRILAGSTTENVGFDKSVTDAAISLLREMATEIAPGLAGLDIVDSWAGLRPFAADGMPVLGAIGAIRGLHIATAHYRNGILLAPITAKLIAESLVSGAGPECFGIFGPGRFTPRRAGSGE